MHLASRGSIRAKMRKVCWVQLQRLCERTQIARKSSSIDPLLRVAACSLLAQLLTLYCTGVAVPSVRPLAYESPAHEVGDLCSSEPCACRLICLGSYRFVFSHPVRPPVLRVVRLPALWSESDLPRVWCEPRRVRHHRHHHWPRTVALSTNAISGNFQSVHVLGKCFHAHL